MVHITYAVAVKCSVTQTHTHKVRKVGKGWNTTIVNDVDAALATQSMWNIKKIK